MISTSKAERKHHPFTGSRSRLELSRRTYVVFARQYVELSKLGVGDIRFQNSTDQLNPRVAPRGHPLLLATHHPLIRGILSPFPCC